MEPSSHSFKANAHQALRDDNLQSALSVMEAGFAARRAGARDRLPEFDQLRAEARRIKDEALANLDYYLEQFEAKVIESGGVVHWCVDADEACQTVLDICRQAGARTVTKGKSMVTEEIALNPFLEKHGVTPVETDLGEYIIQLADEPPSHIVGPAMHKTKEQVADLFLEHHAHLGFSARETEPRRLVAQGRKVLRERYFQADVGITGANYLIAETGSTVIVTNEGNGDLTQSLPDTHIVVTSIEKIAPTLEDAATLLRVLARSATGQEMSVYTTFSTGPRRADDRDGPKAFHVVLVDNGRSRLLASDKRELLRCLRCGACLNHCPVFGAVGGHSYGWVYSGPIGAALDPFLLGLEETRDLPFASSLCGRCEAVCPVGIPLPRIFRQWRAEAAARKLTPRGERWGVWLWAWVACRPRAYRMAARLGSAVLRVLAGRRGRLRHLPGAGGWTAARDFPAPTGRPFMAQWNNKQDLERRTKENTR
jgi:L-lactate dehydrogenase complex protein LldF